MPKRMNRTEWMARFEDAVIGIYMDRAREQIQEEAEALHKLYGHREPEDVAEEMA